MPSDPKNITIVDHRELIRNILKSITDEQVSLARTAARHESPVFVIGRNSHSRRVLEKITIDGVIDDFETQAFEWNGLHILRSANVPPDAIVINCSMSISPLSTRARIASIPNVRQLSYSELCHLEPTLLPLPDFVIDARRSFETSSDRLDWIFASLCDEVSREIFNQIMSYRLTADPSHMKGFTVRLKDQYFEPFTSDLRNSIFVDCGGFDGDTTEEFIRRNPEYTHVFFFEPSLGNLKRARRRLAGLRDIDFISLGVSDVEGELLFDANRGSACAVSDSGQEKIRVTTLDSHIINHVSFIKMDLEGWELQALRGARRHIVEDRTILAIAVYHTIADFWRIPEYILSINPNYDLYLRHYTEGWSETVMYFIPKAQANRSSLKSDSTA